MADEIIPADQQDQIIKAFDRLQHEGHAEELHEKYYGLANRLVQECVR